MTDAASTGCISSEQSRGEYMKSLLAGVQGYARSYARKVCRKYPHVRYAEVLEEVQFGLEIAACKFDPERGAKFLTFAAWWARERALSYVRAEAAQGWTYPHNGRFLITFSHGYDALRGDKRNRCFKPANLPDDSATQFWATVNKHLPERERELLDRVYVHGDTFEAVGRRWGLSRERVRQIHARALNRVKQMVPGPTLERLCRETLSNGG